MPPGGDVVCFSPPPLPLLFESRSGQVGLPCMHHRRTEQYGSVLNPVPLPLHCCSCARTWSFHKQCLEAKFGAFCCRPSERLVVNAQSAAPCVAATHVHCPTLICWGAKHPSQCICMFIRQAEPCLSCLDDACKSATWYALMRHVQLHRQSKQ